ncbi:MAG TPA: HypC/HybG/HupF family hydrogenase formation chaperone [Conexibacter sp.]|nr:HypC/HybG/HupF family hydrogenase formation chaperone [Conexibacter sp.]
MSAREPGRLAGTARGLSIRTRVVREEGGMPMRVLALDPAGGTLARCAGTDGIPVTVETALVRPLEPGAVVLVQAGIALVRLDSEWVP